MYIVQLNGLILGHTLSIHPKVPINEPYVYPQYVSKHFKR